MTAVERAVGERQLRRVRGDGRRGRRGSGLAFGAHGGEHAADRGQFAAVEVGGDDARAAAVGLEGVPARTAAEVEDAVTWT